MSQGNEDGNNNGSLSDEFYSNFIDKEKIIDQWMLTRSPLPVVSVLVVYLLMLRAGPVFMQNRRPYHLKTVMRVYNVIQVIYNTFMVYHFIVPEGGVVPVYFLTNISCVVPEYFEGLERLKYLYLFGGWNFLILKIMDLLDTAFMILRKKNSHITFLHVYHHSAMVFFSWFSLRYIKATQGGIPVFINLVVHACMYSYYFLATFRSFKQYLWWKRHLTKLQLGQFAVILSYICVLYYKECQISRAFTYIWSFNVFVILCLFVNFYINAYITNQNKENNNRIKKS